MSKIYIRVRIAMGFLLLIFAFVLSRHAGIMASGRAVTVGQKKPVIVIDVGHGRETKPNSTNCLYLLNIQT